jgi:hypothetical protein
MDAVGDIANLDHTLHVRSILACGTHVNGVEMGDELRSKLPAGNVP